MDSHDFGQDCSNASSSHGGCARRALAERSIRSIASRSAASRRNTAFTNPAAHGMPRVLVSSTVAATAAWAGTRREHELVDTEKSDGVNALVARLSRHRRRQPGVESRQEPQRPECQLAREGRLARRETRRDARAQARPQRTAIAQHVDEHRMRQTPRCSARGARAATDRGRRRVISDRGRGGCRARYGVPGRIPRRSCVVRRTVEFR